MVHAFRKFRAFADLTQEELGQALGITQTAISNYERGVRDPELEVARRFLRLAACYKYATSLDDVYAEVGKTMKKAG